VPVTIEPARNASAIDKPHKPSLFKKFYTVY